MPWTETIDVNTGEVKRFYLREPGEPRRTVRVIVDPARNWRGSGIRWSACVFEIFKTVEGKEFRIGFFEHKSFVEQEIKRQRKKGYREFRIVEHTTQGEIFDCISEGSA